VYWDNIVFAGATLPNGRIDRLSGLVTKNRYEKQDV